MKIDSFFNTVFEPALIQEIENNSIAMSLKADDPILQPGQLIKHIPLILSGTVKVTRTDEDGRELLLYYVNPLESCAMTLSCCMQQHESEISAVAEDDVELLAVPLQIMDQWILKFPSWRIFVMKTMQQRFNEMLKAIDQLAFQKLDERLVNFLREKSKATNSSLINLSHEQIATQLASSRVVVSRLLKALENDKKILLYRHQIKLLKGF
ncbi:Crp/Fnr family transcriptional regulator [Fluviicola taffensis]|uniref:Transcriptional regulator, Crp/Fnr family n=1 Tax=Fluviicola taffensis (strain DSM 16823 / NCIMB 13979 / RW262) TaxID=755732 RepID=F2IJT8_FLUTR|nr:Crp/Fnr family transcriptional regulator [Fluviicola taffensis]AEA44997.1 transcriptional regulator, Crp/Fnr family [Fluviicola taffensis DSM 16823]